MSEQLFQVELWGEVGLQGVPGGHVVFDNVEEARAQALADWWNRTGSYRMFAPRFLLVLCPDSEGLVPVHRKMIRSLRVQPLREAIR